MQPITKNEKTERLLFLLDISKLDQLPADFVPNTYFGLFLACDARHIPDQVITHIARFFIEKGMVYLCSWGPDCERVHDLFDSVIEEMNPNETEKSVRMTTWLEQETLDEALWEFMNVAFPADDYWDECKVELIVVVDNQQWTSHVRARLNDQSGLSKDVVGDGNDDEEAAKKTVLKKKD